jgi:hypothetical protein
MAHWLLIIVVSCNELIIRIIAGWTSSVKEVGSSKFEGWAGRGLGRPAGGSKLLDGAGSWKQRPS